MNQLVGVATGIVLGIGLTVLGLVVAGYEVKLASNSGNAPDPNAVVDGAEGAPEGSMGGPGGGPADSGIGGRGGRPAGGGKGFKNGQAPGSRGSSPGGGGGGFAGMGGGMGAMFGGGGGGRGQNSKRQLTTLVRKLSLLTGDVAIRLSDEQTQSVLDALADVADQETMTDDDAKEKYEALTAILTDEQIAKQENVGLPFRRRSRSGGGGGRGGRGGGGGGGRGGGGGGGGGGFGGFGGGGRGGGGNEDENPFASETSGQALDALLARLRGEPAPAGEQQSSGGRGWSRLKENDSDGDGKISKDEAPENLKRFFDRLDKNGDGFIEESELSSSRGGNRPAPADDEESGAKKGSGGFALPESGQAFVALFDKDKNGKVSKEELPAELKRGIDFWWKNVDSNSDDAVDEKEADAMIEQFKNFGGTNR